MIDCKEILRALPLLTRTDLQKVRERVAVLLGSEVLQAGGQDETTLILGVICSTLHQAGVEFVQPAVLRKMSSYPSFVRKVPALTTYLDRAQLRQKRERQAVLAVGVLLLRENLLRLQIPCDASMIMRHVHRIPACLECEFPNYAACGLLGKAIKRGVPSVRTKPSRKPDAGSGSSDRQRPVLHPAR